MRIGSVKWVIFAVTSLGNFIGMLDFSSVNIALYRISQAFDLPVSAVQWVMLSYQIVLTSLLTFFGRLGDGVSRRKLYACGFLVFGTGALLSGTAVNFGVLLFARTVQGIGGAILISNSFSIVSGVFKGRSRGKALGFLGAVTHLAGMTAPSIGGFLLDSSSWRAIFIPGCALSFAAFLPALRILPVGKTAEKVRIDVKGTILLMIGVASLLFAVAQAPSWGILSVRTGACAVVAAVFMTFFVRHEKRAAAPLVSFHLFEKPVFLFSNLALMLSYPAMYPNTVIFPFYSQEVLGNSPTLTGLLILPFSLFYLMTAVATGTLPPKKRMFAGMILLGAGLFAFTFAGMNAAVWSLVAMQIVMGVGNALFQPSVNTVILNATPKDSTGMASGILSLFRNTGIAAGSVVSVGLYETYRQNALAGGADIRTASLSAYHFALFCGIGFALVCLTFIIKAVRTKQ